MSQMNASDLAVVKALPGNDKCADCGMKHPQWASVSFGTVFCLECSGVHRSLGVHISFVRSIAMDSWTPAQLTIMKAGGNDKCNSYLSARGISSDLPIKQKYDCDAAKLYKLVLKARAEGKVEPTSLPAPSSAPSSGNSFNNMSNHSVGNISNSSINNNSKNKVEDPNGMERLTGESDSQYIARQTRLREEAKARMAAKFGNSKRMGGVGSSASYSSSSSYYGNSASSGGGVDFSMESITGSIASGLGSAAYGLGSAWSRAKETVSSSTAVDDVTNNMSGLWTSFAKSARNVAESLAAMDDVSGEDDGLSDFNQRMKLEREGRTTSYAGFGSESSSMGQGFGNNYSNNNSATSYSNTSMSGGTVAHGPDEDPNGLALLRGETEQQYMERQKRIQAEAKARMEAKFGKNRSMSSAGSNSSSNYTNSANGSGFGNSVSNSVSSTTASRSISGGGTTIASGSSATPKKVTAVKMKMDSDDDFFASFGA